MQCVSKDLELQSENLKRQNLFSKSARLPATPAYACTALTQTGLSSQCGECWLNSILTNWNVSAAKTRIWQYNMPTDFHQEWSSKTDNVESSLKENPAMKSAISCQSMVSEATFQSPAIESRHSHLNFGAPQLPELYACNHHSSALCEMTYHYAFIPL